MTFMRTLGLLLIPLALIWIVGCSKRISGDPPALPPGTEHGHDDHDHHEHAHLGPNGGHLLELGNEQFHAEWTHDDDSGKLTVYILDAAGKELVPIAAEKVTIEKNLAGKTVTYDLLPVGRQG